MLGALLGPAIGAIAGGLMSDDDSGGQQTTTTEPPEFLKPFAPLYAQMGFDLSQAPYQPYNEQRVAGFTPDQFMGMDMVRQRALQGSPLNAQAQGQLQGTLSGDYLGRQTQANPFMGQATQVSSNPFAGSNSYLDDMIGRTSQDVTRNFQNATAPGTDAAFARAGAFGGSAWQQAQTENQRALAQELGRVSSGMRMQDYGMQQQLAESDITRRMQAQMTDLGRNAQLGEGMAGRNDALYNAERGRQMQSAGMAPELAATDYRDAEALLNTGGMQQQLGQAFMNDDYSQFQEARGYPREQFGILGSLFQNPGLGGQSTTQLPGVPMANGLLGGAMAGQALGGSLGNASGRQGANWGPIGGGWGSAPANWGQGQFNPFS